MYTAQLTIERIQSLIKEKGLTQKEVLKQCDINENTLKRMTDNKGMSSFYIAKIADQLNCSVDYLLGRTDNPNITAKTYINGENSIQAVVGSAIEHNTVTISNTDEMTKEISLLLSDLTYRQKTELMKEIYDFVDSTKKEVD